jgi:hypothetical protein
VVIGRTAIRHGSLLSKHSPTNGRTHRRLDPLMRPANLLPIMSILLLNRAFNSERLPKHPTVEWKNPSGASLNVECNAPPNGRGLHCHPHFHVFGAAFSSSRRTAVVMVCVEGSGNRAVWVRNIQCETALQFPQPTYTLSGSRSSFSSVTSPLAAILEKDYQ